MSLSTNGIWEQVLAEAELEITNAEFSAFLLGSKLESIKDGVAIISCRNRAEQYWLQSHSVKLLIPLLTAKLGSRVKLKFKIRKLKNNPAEKNMGPLFSVPTTKAGLDPLYTFANFAVSDSNQLAYAAAQAVVKNPGRAYNPLFLWGGVGVGKTHLMQAVGHAILKKNPAAKIVFCMGEEFTNEIIEAIKNKTTGAFKRKYRSAQLLLLDDVQFIADKIKVQEEFFHTFVSVKREGGQIILTSDRPPQEILEFQARLRSRFEAGLIADIAPPNFELRTAIVLIKARQRGKEISMETARFLAENIDDTRRIEGVLIRLITEAEINGREIDLAFAAKILDKVPSQTTPLPPVSVGEVIKKISARFRVTLADLKSKKRSRPIAVPRQIAMYLLREELRMSFQDVGTLLGGRDHTTIMHGVEKVKKVLLKDPRWSGEILGIKKEVWGKYQ